MLEFPAVVIKIITNYASNLTEITSWRLISSAWNNASRSELRKWNTCVINDLKALSYYNTLDLPFTRFQIDALYMRRENLEIFFDSTLRITHLTLAPKNGMKCHEREVAAKREVALTSLGGPPVLGKLMCILVSRPTYLTSLTWTWSDEFHTPDLIAALKNFCLPNLQVFEVNFVFFKYRRPQFMLLDKILEPSATPKLKLFSLIFQFRNTPLMSKVFQPRSEVLSFDAICPRLTTISTQRSKSSFNVGLRIRFGDREVGSLRISDIRQLETTGLAFSSILLECTTMPNDDWIAAFCKWVAKNSANLLTLEMSSVPLSNLRGMEFPKCTSLQVKTLAQTDLCILQGLENVEKLTTSTITFNVLQSEFFSRLRELRVTDVIENSWYCVTGEDVQPTQADILASNIGLIENSKSSPFAQMNGLRFLEIHTHNDNSLMLGILYISKKLDLKRLYLLTFKMTNSTIQNLDYKKQLIKCHDTVLFSVGN